MFDFQHQAQDMMIEIIYKVILNDSIGLVHSSPHQKRLVDGFLWDGLVLHSL